MILNHAVDEKNGISRTTSIESNKINGSRKENGINKSLKRCDKPSIFMKIIYKMETTIKFERINFWDLI